MLNLLLLPAWTMALLLDVMNVISLRRESAVSSSARGMRL